MIFFNVEQLQKIAIENYVECPKFLTVARHADKEDESEFHSVWMGYFLDGSDKQKRVVCEKRVFSVPKQNLIIRYDKKFGRFVVVRVGSEFSSEEFWLVVSIRTRRGFLLQLNAFTPTDYVEDTNLSAI